MLLHLIFRCHSLQPGFSGVVETSFLHVCSFQSPCIALPTEVLGYAAGGLLLSSSFVFFLAEILSSLAFPHLGLAVFMQLGVFRIWGFPVCNMWTLLFGTRFLSNASLRDPERDAQITSIPTPCVESIDMQKHAKASFFLESSTLFIGRNAQPLSLVGLIHNLQHEEVSMPTALFTTSDNMKSATITMTLDLV